MLIKKWGLIYLNDHENNQGSKLNALAECITTTSWLMHLLVAARCPQSRLLLDLDATLLTAIATYTMDALLLWPTTVATIHNSSESFSCATMLARHSCQKAQHGAYTVCYCNSGIAAAWHYHYAQMLHTGATAAYFPFFLIYLGRCPVNGCLLAMAMAASSCGWLWMLLGLGLRLASPAVAVAHVVSVATCTWTLRLPRHC
ncbi:hypothetical protein Acr_00g0047890 [Actinidia rufa]|uniref:Uncharacterized protein n=1 Tax=Actinidia rufa TaxID=165716 RepID=A0A7J0DJV8_9ERIC|nr:hypothetical protein Acr_00g0047890 [Actinidia rufa]